MPPQLNRQRLARVSGLPIDWRAQRELLGFASIFDSCAIGCATVAHRISDRQFDAHRKCRDQAPESRAKSVSCTVLQMLCLAQTHGKSGRTSETMDSM